MHNCHSEFKSQMVDTCFDVYCIRWKKEDAKNSLEDFSFFYLAALTSCWNLLEPGQDWLVQPDLPVLLWISQLRSSCDDGLITEFLHAALMVMPDTLLTVCAFAIYLLEAISNL